MHLPGSKFTSSHINWTQNNDEVVGEIEKVSYTVDGTVIWHVRNKRTNEINYASPGRIGVGLL